MGGHEQCFGSLVEALSQIKVWKVTIENLGRNCQLSGSLNGACGLFPKRKK